MKIIRVFPRKTRATPTDDLVRINKGPDLFDEADEVHISVAFSWDLPLVEKLARMWRDVAPVTIGGPALNERGGDFTPGMYLRPGYVITSRGCPNRCWFCSVPRREGGVIRELPITEGHNVIDDNLLACSDAHIRDVFAMLANQKDKIEFTGGLEAARLKIWHAKELKKLRIKQMFFAYDMPDDLEPLQQAGKYLQDVGFQIHPHSHSLRCFVLCGYQGDSISHAKKRIREAMQAGFTPMAMLWKDESGNQDQEWRKFQREWARPAIIYGGGNAKL